MALGFTEDELTAAFGILEELEPSIMQVGIRIGNDAEKENPVDRVGSADNEMALSIDFVVENGIDFTRQEAAERLQRFVYCHIRAVFQTELNGVETVVESAISFGEDGLITVDFSVEKKLDMGFFRIRLENRNP